MFWNMKPIKDIPDLKEKLKQISGLQPQPEVHIRGDESGRYEFIGKVVVALQQEGIYKVAFITEPPPHGGG
jgi:biopolymer transport protein ExbD